MTPFFRNKPASYVGLAVHHERLSMIKLKRIRKQMIIEGVAMLALPAGSMVDGRVKYSDQLVQLIRRWVEGNRLTHCTAALALPVSQMINKKIRVAAYLNETEQSAEISSNLTFYLPGMDERLYFDFIPLGKEAQEIELQLIAARAEHVEVYMDVIQAAGLKINVVDVDVYAIVRAVQWLLHPLLDQTFVLLDRDSTSAQLILVKQGKIISVYPIVCDDEAIFLQQIKRGMHIFFATEQSMGVEKLLLTGDTSHSEKLKQSLESELSLSVEKMHSFQPAEIDSSVNSETLNASASEWLTAFGLALRGFPRD